MKLCSFNVGEINRIGVLMPNGQVADCNYAYAAYLVNRGVANPQKRADVIVPSEMIPMIECGEDGKNELRLAMAYIEANPDVTGPCGEQILYNCEDIHFRAPVPNPEKIFSMAINNKFEFERCIKPEGPAHPLYFSKYNSCLCGAYDDIEIPDIGIVGTEVEMVFVIGRGGKNVPKEKANDYIYGFTCHNDITAFTLRMNREWLICVNGEGKQEKVMYPGRYKCFDTFAPMGPWLVTVDELPIETAFNQRMEAYLDNKKMQEGSTDEMLFRVDYMIPYLSAAHTLKPGDLCSCGTVISFNEKEFDNADLRSYDGKILESYIEHLGTMKNHIKAI